MRLEQLLKRDKLELILLLAIIAGLAIYFLFFIYNACISILYPYTRADGMIFTEAYKLSQGISIWQDISTYPYLRVAYTPVPALISAGLFKLFGPSFAIGRAITLIAAILVGVLIYKIVADNTRNRYIAIVSSLLFFASPYTYCVSVTFAQHNIIAILWCLIGIYLLLKYEGSKKVYLCIPFFLLAIYTKQIYIAAPVASVIYLFLKNKRLAIKIALLYGLSGLFIFLLATYLTRGQFYLHLIVYNLAEYSVFKVIVQYVRTIMLHPVLLGLAGAFALYAISRRKRSLFVIYFITSATVGVTVGRAGCHPKEHLLEAVAVSCILFGFFFNRAQQWIKGDRLARILVGVMLLLQLVAFAHAPYVADSVFLSSQTPTRADVSNSQKVSSYIKNAEGKVLCQDIGLATLNGKEALFMAPDFAQFHKWGLWDQSEFVSDLQDREFSLIVLLFDVNSEVWKENFNYFHTVEMINAIRNNYHLIEKIGENYIYEPNGGVIR